MLALFWILSLMFVVDLQAFSIQSLVPESAWVFGVFVKALAMFSFACFKLELQSPAVVTFHSVVDPAKCLRAFSTTEEIS